MRGRRPISLNVDPPPDPCLEIENSRSTLDRMSIYAALRVPEVWRWDGETLTVHRLTTKGNYRVSKRSKAFPFLPMEEFAAFLKHTNVGATKLIRELRAWARDHKDAWMKQ